MIAQLPKIRQAVIRLLLWLTVGSGGVVCGETRDPVELYLPKEAVINRSLVTVADVAQLKGGTPELRALIGAIDLAELTQDASSETIRASQLELRLKLAGIDSARFRLSGASSTRDHPPPRALARRNDHSGGARPARRTLESRSFRSPAAARSTTIGSDSFLARGKRSVGLPAVHFGVVSARPTAAECRSLSQRTTCADLSRDR